jgi:Tol biopolymer transport system component
MREHVDPLTGRSVVRWTEPGVPCQGLYLTSSSVTADDRCVVVIGDRDSSPNLFVIDRSDGAMRPLSRNARGQMHSYVYPLGTDAGFARSSPCLAPLTGDVLWIQDRSACLANVREPDAARRVLELPAGWMTAFNDLSPDGRLACVPIADARAFVDDASDQVSQMIPVARRFREQALRSRILVIDLRRDATVADVEVPFWVTHVQFGPLDPTQVLFNQEGMGSDVGQRIWIADTASGRIRPLYPQAGVEWCCHEVFAADGSVVSHGGVRGQKSAFVERHDLSGRLLERHDISDARFMHATLSNDGRSFILDDHDGMLKTWEIATGRSGVLCRHGSSMNGQDNHPHARMTSSGRGVTFTSDGFGGRGLFEVRLDG